MKDKNLMTGTYTYDELVKAYDNFCTPSAAIYVGNSTENIITAKNAAVDSIEIILSSEETAALSFRITNAFDLTNHSIRNEIKETFSPGTIIKAALGYGSNLTTVFKGYVTEYRTVYRDSPFIHVTAVDFRKLLMENKREKYKYTEDTYSKIFEQIITDYSKLYDTLHIDTVEEKGELIQSSTDYKFIKDELCRKADRAFFVVAGDVYFKKPDKSTSPFLELEWGKNLISFQSGKSYCNEQIRAYSSQGDKTGNMCSKDIKTDEETPSLTSQTRIEEWELGGELDNRILQNWLEKREEEKRMRMKTAAGSVMGMPELVPGRYIRIKGVDPDDAGVYHIKEVRHSFDSSGFTTDFLAGDENDRWTAGESREGAEASGRCMGMMRAVVKENWNEEEPGKVLVEFLTGEQGKNGTKWLPVLSPYCGAGYGFYVHPEIGTEVLVGSLMGDINSLMVIGSMWNQVDQIPENTAGEENIIKKFRTKGNHEIIFDDGEDSGQIKICTNKKLLIELKDKEKSISISDENGKNGIVIDGENESIRLFAGKKITLSVDGTDAFVIDGKKLTMNGDKLTEKAGQSFQIQAQKLEIKGDITELKSSSMKINSSGMAEIKGSLIKIN